MSFPLPRFVLSLVLLAAASPAFGAEPDAKRCQYLSLATLPVRYSGPGLEITTDGKIEGKPATMLVDTGAWETLLTRTGADRHGLFMRNTGATAEGVGGYARVYNAMVRDFSVGPAKAARGYIRVLDDFGTPPSYDGIIGAPFLLQSDLEISLATKELRFFRPYNCSKDSFLAYWDENAVVVPFASTFSRRDNPEFEVLLNGKTLRALIDTGAASSFVTSDGARRAGLKLDAPGVERAGHVMGVGEDKVARWTATFDTLQIGAETIRNVPIGVLDANHLDIDLLLGADFLRSHRVLFAMSQRKLYLSYVGGEALSHARAGIEAWVLKEAEGGNADAQLVLATLYLKSGDAALARTWTERAAANGNARANAQLGRALMRSGDYAGAAAPLRKALDLLPHARHTALWLYVARTRSGQAELGRQELEAAFARKDEAWPWPIAAFHLGKLDENKLLAQAREDKRQAGARACQAWSHIAERRAIEGKSEEAQAAQARQRQECGPAPAAQ